MVFYLSVFSIKFLRVYLSIKATYIIAMTKNGGGVQQNPPNILHYMIPIYIIEDIHQL